ncbi:MAG: hypothetical protein P4L10_04190 [Acidobacteriaceae bacterium]|nr:hypothetical protein [Acidobacteriaceae bacterium]
MKLRFFALLFAFVLLSITAQAQTGLYLNPVAIRVSNSVADTGPYAFLGSGNTSQMFYGVSLGGYYDFKHTSSIGLGVDMRDAITHGNSAMLNSFLVGVRLNAKPLAKPFNFYIEPVVGMGTTRSPHSPRRLSKEQFGVFGGVDYPIQKHIDWRIAEVGYSSLSTINSSNFGYPLTISSSKLLSITTGLVFRIH